MTLLRTAEDFAKTAHGDQKRKYTGEPYWHHLKEVARTLMQYGATPDVVAAGWLHDTLEDTKTTYQELCLTFGHVIANMVVEVTDVSRPDSGNTPEGIGNRTLRKAIDRQFVAGASWRGQMIKCADILSNTASIVENDIGFARIYVAEKGLLIDALEKARQAQYPIWREAYDCVVQAQNRVRRAA
ncbi:HD domain-containing protein [Bradyrhizobium sp. AZCC 1610]|uniref:HD domain-containing protein n=1 Tax=Bradyrhizobium sp. AZCC 1610 TaxID=3117020 RepID=UPI002FF1622A